MIVSKNLIFFKELLIIISLTTNQREKSSRICPEPSHSWSQKSQYNRMQSLPIIPQTSFLLKSYCNRIEEQNADTSHVLPKVHPKALGNKGLWKLELLGNAQVKIKSVLSISETEPGTASRFDGPCWHMVPKIPKTSSFKRQDTGKSATSN